MDTALTATIISGGTPHLHIMLDDQRHNFNELNIAYHGCNIRTRRYWTYIT